MAVVELRYPIFLVGYAEDGIGTEVCFSMREAEERLRQIEREPRRGPGPTYHIWQTNICVDTDKLTRLR